jgi:hypothetical protein
MGLAEVQRVAAAGEALIIEEALLDCVDGNTT